MRNKSHLYPSDFLERHLFQVHSVYSHLLHTHKHIHTDLSVMLSMKVSPVFQSFVLSSHVQTHIKTQFFSYHANSFTYTTLGTISSRMQIDFLSIHSNYSVFCTYHMSSQQILEQRTLN